MKVLKHKDSNEILHWCTDEHSIIDIRNRAEKPEDETRDWHEVIKPIVEEDRTVYDTEWIGIERPKTIEEQIAEISAKAKSAEDKAKIAIQGIAAISAGMEEPTGMNEEV